MEKAGFEKVVRGVVRSVATMTSITSVIIEVTDTAAAEQFYAQAFGLGDRVQFRETTTPASGFRGFTLSLLVSQPGDATILLDGAIAAGAAVLKPATRSLWGFGGSVQAPDGTIWKVATSAKKDFVAPSAKVDGVVLLLGAEDVGASKRFYVEHGVEVGKSFGSYVDFSTPASPIGLGLYKHRALAKDAGVAPESTGSHRLSIVGDVGVFSDPDGFRWETAGSTANVS